MMKYYSFIIFLFIVARFAPSSFAQELKKEISDETSLNKPIACIDCPKIKEPFNFLPLPVMQNTGNPEKDAADYEMAKEKWINEVLSLLPKNLDGSHRDKIREILLKEKLESVVQGKVLITE